MCQISAFGQATSSERGRTSTDPAAHFGTSSMSFPICCSVTPSQFSFLYLLPLQEEIEELEHENRLHTQQVLILEIESVVEACRVQGLAFNIRTDSVEDSTASKKSLG